MNTSAGTYALTSSKWEGVQLQHLTNEDLQWLAHQRRHVAPLDAMWVHDYLREIGQRRTARVRALSADRQRFAA